jgi:hypothetical protein
MYLETKGYIKINVDDLDGIEKIINLKLFKFRSLMILSIWVNQRVS